MPKAFEMPSSLTPEQTAWERKEAAPSYQSYRPWPPLLKPHPYSWVSTRGGGSVLKTGDKRAVCTYAGDCGSRPVTVPAIKAIGTVPSGMGIEIGRGGSQQLHNGTGEDDA